MKKYIHLSNKHFFSEFTYWASRKTRLHKEFANNALIKGHSNIRYQVFSSELIKELMQ